LRLTRLEIAGFGAFREPMTIEFTDTDFFALVGPTGSGKSTVIDAVCFVLYGSVPRYEDRRLTRYVVTLGASEARVSLTFELEETSYLATRVVRRSAKDKVTTKEARLERVEPDGSTSVLAGAEREMNTAVEALLHLDFDDFTKCVVLPQGEFARFLRAKGDERRELLIKLLNLDIYLEVGRRAGQLAESAKSQATLHRQRLDVLAFATDDALKEVTKRTKSITKLAGQAGKARPKIDANLRLAEGQQRLEADARRLVQLLGKVTVPDEARRHGEVLTIAQKELGEAQERAAAARTARLAAETATEGLPDLVELQGALAAHRALARCITSLEAAAEAAAEAAGKEAEAKQALDDAEATLERTAAELAALETAHRAEDLAQRLVVGELCPVCRQVVKIKPAHHALQALTKAKRAEDAAKKAASVARAALAAATGKSGEAKGMTAALETERQGLDAQIKAHPELEKVTIAIAETKEKLDALAAIRKAEDGAAGGVETKKKALEKLGEKSAALQTTYGAQRDTVAVLEPPAPTNAGLLTDWETLARWAAAAVPVQEEAAGKAASSAADHRATAQSQTQELLDECTGLGVEVIGDIVAVLTALAQAGAEAEAESGRISDAIAETKELSAKVKELDEQAEVASALRGLLRANRFPEWLIAEALELLVIDASTTLRRLTNDEFSLDLGEQEFMVIDHANADEQRSARTLSGGETFQASLALALALSDQIRNLAAQGAPMLDALFLDEGFGTLDPETLETVAATIENLGQSGRMVGIITHVRELAARVPVRFEVRKGPRTSTIEKITA